MNGCDHVDNGISKTDGSKNMSDEELIAEYKAIMEEQSIFRRYSTSIIGILDRTCDVEQIKKIITYDIPAIRKQESQYSQILTWLSMQLTKNGYTHDRYGDIVKSNTRGVETTAQPENGFQNSKILPVQCKMDALNVDSSSWVSGIRLLLVFWIICIGIGFTLAWITH